MHHASSTAAVPAQRLGVHQHQPALSHPFDDVRGSTLQKAYDSQNAAANAAHSTGRISSFVPVARMQQHGQQVLVV